MGRRPLFTPLEPLRQGQGRGLRRLEQYVHVAVHQAQSSVRREAIPRVSGRSRRSITRLDTLSEHPLRDSCDDLLRVVLYKSQDVWWVPSQIEYHPIRDRLSDQCLRDS